MAANRGDLITNAITRTGDVGEFVTIGAVCSRVECSQQDFLPFTCTGCKKPYCLSHARPAAHGCPSPAQHDHTVFVCPLCKRGVTIVPDEDINATFSRHEATPECRGGRGEKKKRRCALQGCRELLGVTNNFTCKVCRLDFCVAHRLDLAHKCAGPPRKPGFFGGGAGGGGGSGGSGGSSSSSNSSSGRSGSAAPAAGCLPGAKPPNLPPIKAPPVDEVRATADRRKRAPEPKSPTSPHTPCAIV